MKCSTTPLLAVGAFTLLINACARDDRATATGASDISSRAKAGNADVDCENRYAGLSKTGECVEIAGVDGRWAAKPLFDDAPPESGSCLYTWSGDHAAPADWHALAGATRLQSLIPACDSPNDAGAEPTLEPLPALSDPHTPVGATGCDVCGFEKHGKIWVVLPWNVLFREVAVPLSNGQERAFKIEGASAASFLSVDLPPPPAGATYLDGPIFVQ